MSDYGVFPFGEEVKSVVQSDRSPKQMFILGVYASAVHARWIGVDGSSLVTALAVASEPEIFWRGNGAEGIISEIQIPDSLGQLVPASSHLNGPSGRSLDDEYLSPLGLGRSQVWLCDIYPYAHMNPRQQGAIEREYNPLMEEYDLPEPTIKPAPTSDPGTDRREEIWHEFEESQARCLVLLGDKPIKWFLTHFEPNFNKLSDFGKETTKYGQIHPFIIRDKQVSVIPLAHPRQASSLGASSSEWQEIHKHWKTVIAGGLLGSALR